MCFDKSRRLRPSWAQDRGGRRRHLGSRTCRALRPCSWAHWTWGRTEKCSTCKAPFASCSVAAEWSRLATLCCLSSAGPAPSAYSRTFKSLFWVCLSCLLSPSASHSGCFAHFWILVLQRLNCHLPADFQDLDTPMSFCHLQYFWCSHAAYLHCYTFLSAGVIHGGKKTLKGWERCARTSEDSVPSLLTLVFRSD